MGEQNGEFIFDDIELAEFPVTIQGTKYTLREADGDAGRQYRNAVLSSTRLTGGKVSGLRNLDDANQLILFLCIFDEHGKTVPSNTIKRWPNRIVVPMIEKVKEMSNLDEDEGPSIADLEKQLAEAKEREELAKNDLSPTEDGSG